MSTCTVVQMCARKIDSKLRNYIALKNEKYIIFIIYHLQKIIKRIFIFKNLQLLIFRLKKSSDIIIFLIFSVSF